MSRISGVLVGFLLLFILIDTQQKATYPVYVEHSHWNMENHYVHVVKLDYYDHQTLYNTVIEFEPAIYESYIEIRFTTSEADDFYEIYDQIEDKLYQITTNVEVR